MSQKKKGRRFRFTIGFKLVVLLVFVLATAVGSNVYFSTELYEEDNTALIQQLNLDTATHQAAQVRQLLQAITRKIHFLSVVLNESKWDAASLEKHFFQGEEEFLALILTNHKQEHSELQRVLIPENTRKNGVSQKEELFELVRSAKAFSLNQLSKGEPQVAAVRLGDGTLAIVLGVPVIEDSQNSNQFSMSATALIRHSAFLKAFSQSDIVTSYLLDRRGQLLVHPDTSLAVGEENFSYLEIVKQLLQGKYSNGQTRFLDEKNQLAKLGAFSVVGFAGLGVVAEVPEAKAFEASQRVKYRSVLISLIVLSLALVMGMIYSESLTWPIKQLVHATEKIASGDFSFRLKPKTRDEVADLSLAFNDMVEGLRERDRVKETFNKFHNKEIAEKLLSGEVKLGGESRTALIFFSDIRGFTQMSESMAPEAIVEMLNEYMSRMVSIIRKYNGVVDKYVGDAIMATWGVPVENENDAHNALSACLAMRLELQELNRIRTERGQPTLLIGMGLNRGPVVAGNIGSNEKMDYTVIGDSVNVASRVESMTKILGTDLLVTESVYEELKSAFVFENCQEISVKGKRGALKVYRVLGYFSEEGKPISVETPFSSYEIESHGSESHLNKNAA